MAAPYCYDYPRASVTVDAAVFVADGPGLSVLLIRRDRDPFRGCWAIPGGFLEMDEEPEAGARRELEEETGVVCPSAFFPVGFFGAVGRDPRGRTISLAYCSAVGTPAPEARGEDDASQAAWVPLAQARGLAFDHDAILAAALGRLRGEVSAGDLGLTMLPDPFRVADVRSLLGAVGADPKGAAGWVRRQLSAGRIARTTARGTGYRRAEAQAPGAAGGAG